MMFLNESEIYETIKGSHIFAMILDGVKLEDIEMYE